MSGWGIWLAVAALGAIGAVARFAVDRAISLGVGRSLPFGTLAVNVAGSALAGLVVGLGMRGDGSLLVKTALLGSFTTFSTWMYESHRLAEDGQGRFAAANVGVSLAVGFAAVVAGRALGEAL